MANSAYQVAMVADNNVGQLIRRYEMNKQEIIDYLKGQTEWSGNHHYILVNKSELISMIEDLDESKNSRTR